jgi:hypothetical protein
MIYLLFPIQFPYKHMLCTMDVIEFLLQSSLGILLSFIITELLYYV